MTSVVFRTHASAVIGTGHVRRCLTLAQEMSNRGWSPRFVVDSGTAEFATDLAEFETVSTPATRDEMADAAEMSGLLPERCDLLVVDRYDRGAAFESAMRHVSATVMAIDDTAQRSHDCDILLDQNLGRQAADYQNLASEHCQLLIGPKFALLRPDFAAARNRVLKNRLTRNARNRIFVNFGGADPYRLGSKTFRAIKSSGISAAVTMVFGMASERDEFLEAFGSELDDDDRIHANVRNMADEMAACDIAVGAGGSSSWERCCLALPTILVVMAENQEPAARALRAETAALVVGSFDDLSEEMLTSALVKLLSDHALLEKMALNAAAICDGAGTHRVLNALAELITAPPKQVGANA